MPLSYIRSLLQLGRTHGAALTGACALVGAITSGQHVSWPHVGLIMLAGLLYHWYGCILNEIVDIKLDSEVRELSTKPLVSGAISVRAAWIYLAGCLAGLVAIELIFFRGVVTSILLALTVVMGGYYDLGGKRTPWMGELSLGMGFVAFTFWGAATMGAITPITIVAAVEVFIAVNFSIWGGFMKDVDTDRLQNIPTRPVAWGYSHGQRITPLNRNWLFALGLKALAISIYLMPAFGVLSSGPDVQIGSGVVWHPVRISLAYIYIFCVLGLPGQVFVLYRLLGVHDRLSFTRVCVLDLAFTWVLAAGLLVDQIGLLGALAVYLMPILGAAVFNKIQYAAVTVVPKL